MSHDPSLLAALDFEADPAEILYRSSPGFSWSAGASATAPDRLLGACLHLGSESPGLWLELPARRQPQQALTLSLWFRWAEAPRSDLPASGEVLQAADPLLRIELGREKMDAELASTQVQPDFPGEEVPLRRPFSTDLAEDEPGDWRHVAVVWRGDAQQLLLYIDGALRSAHAIEQGRPPRLGRPGVHIQADTDARGALCLGPIRLYDRELRASELRSERRRDIAEHPTIDERHPIALRLADPWDQPNLYATDDDAPGRPLTVILQNRSRFDQPLAGGAEAPPLELRFRPGCLDASTRGHADAEPRGWRVRTRVREGDGGVSVELRPAEDLVIPAGRSVVVPLSHLKADPAPGAHSSPVELWYRHPHHHDLDCTRVQVVEVVGNRGRRQSPLRLQILGERVLINDGETANTLRLCLVNTSAVHGLTLRPVSQGAPTTLVLSFDWAETEADDWAVATLDQLQDARITPLDPAIRVEEDTQGLAPTWRLLAERPLTLGPRARLEIVVSDLVTSLAAGRARLSLQVRNLEGCWDDEQVVEVEKAPSRLGSDGRTSLGGDLSVDGDLSARGAVQAGGAVMDGLGVLVPAGTIVMWYGPPDRPPAGWAICDGNNGTPDLRGRFVRGLEDTQVEGLWDADGSPKGGARPGGFGVEFHTLGVEHLPPHGHTATATVGSHSHRYRSGTEQTVSVIASSELDRIRNIKEGFELADVVPNPASVLVDEVVKLFVRGGLPGDTAKALNIVGALARVGAAGPGLVDRTSGSAKSAVSVSVGGGGTASNRKALDNRPAYHPLCFIMKLAPPAGGEAG